MRKRDRRKREEQPRVNEKNKEIQANKGRRGGEAIREECVSSGPGNKSKI